MLRGARLNQGGNEHRHQRRALIVAYDDAQIAVATRYAHYM